MHLHNRRKPVIFSVLLLLLLHKCVFACMCHCECVFEWARAELCINKAGHGSCTWPLLINRRSTTNDRTFSFFWLSSFTLRKKKKTQLGARVQHLRCHEWKWLKKTPQILWISFEKFQGDYFLMLCFRPLFFCQIIRCFCWISSEPLNIIQ